MASELMSEIRVLRELEPEMGRLLNQHEKISKLWVPDEFIPWSRGRDFARLGGDDWDESQSPFSEEIRSALIIAGLTEDNLPSYHREIYAAFGGEGAWGAWANTWTVEEDRHGRAIHNLLTVSRAVDPVSLEQDRMAHVGIGFSSDKISGDVDGQREPKTPLEVLPYVAFQELATVIAHKNTGESCKTEGDAIAKNLFQEIKKDETRHWVVYRDLVRAAFDVDPNLTMKAVSKEVHDFKMPGAATIPRFGHHAINIAVAGIYDLTKQNDEVFAPNLGEKHWNVWNRTDLTGDGARARDELAVKMEQLRVDATSFDEFLVIERQKRTQKSKER
jgi:acyl-[acyl-carrier-protein] desaturase